MLLLAWFVIPMILGGAEVNRSRWDPAYKFDSYGAQIILTELFSGMGPGTTSPAADLVRAARDLSQCDLDQALAG